MDRQQQRALSGWIAVCRVRGQFDVSDVGRIPRVSLASQAAGEWMAGWSSVFPSAQRTRRLPSS